MIVRTGLDRIALGDAAAVAAVRGKRIGLVAHPASVSADLVHARHVLAKAGADIRVLFGPEHGYGGEAQDMIGVVGAKEPGTGIPIHSLYGATFDALSPKRGWLDGLDAVVVDLQDVGARYYTFIWTAALVLKAAAAVGVQTIILDRPNPLGGDVVEGAPQRPGYRSFVGLYDVAVRHGLTVGEICMMVREQEGLDSASLHVVPMAGWQRGMYFDETGLPWVLPSPNMPTVDTAVVYPGGCLIEGTNLSEGRGCTRPFEIWGAPFMDGQSLAADVRIEGAILRPLTFLPTFQKHGGKVCGGVQVHVTDRTTFRSYEAYLKLLHAAFRRGNGPAWRTEVYEFVADRPAIDLLTGGPEFRNATDAGADLSAVLHAEAAGARAWDDFRRRWFLYGA